MVQGNRTENSEIRQTCPVRITTEFITPGGKDSLKKMEEGESAIIIIEKVTGAIRSEEDPSVFREKKTAIMETAGFRDIGDIMKLMTDSQVSFLKRIGGDDPDAYAWNLVNFMANFLDASGISLEDVNIQLSDKFMKARAAYAEKQKEEAVARKPS